MAYLHQQFDDFRAHDQFAYLASNASELGRALAHTSRYDDAERFTELGRTLASEQDPLAQMRWRQAQALIESARGHFGPAETLARDGVAFGELTDFLNQQGDALRDLAEVLFAAGRRNEARDVLEQALNRYERKKNLPLAERVRVRLADLEKAGAPTRASPS